jgi:hypothetical protein
LMPDAHESCRKAPSQPHNCSRFIVYTKPSGKAQEAIAFFARKFTGLVQAPIVSSAKVDVVPRAFLCKSFPRTIDWSDYKDNAQDH